ncbi:hypothetical protein GCM10029964_089650 [Kibdelosporangium lantanae]
MRIVAETDKSVAQVARELGISAYTLHNWVRADRRQTEAEQARDGSVSELEREELVRLRTEQARWARERAGSW